ncbi:MAG: AAA family ATPase [Alphaproteobacteria bacterium]
MSSAAAMMNRFREAFQHDEFMAFSPDPAAREVLVGVARLHDWPEHTVQEGGASAALQFLITASAPRRLVVDLSDSPDPVTAVQMLRDTCTPETVIVALGSVNDVTLYRDICRAGADDYLLKPVTKETLAETVEKAVYSHETGVDAAGHDKKLGRLVVFVGARGGVGASTVAVNCAWLMAHEQNIRVALVDLDLQFGTAALGLDLEPSHGLREILANPNRIDALFLTSAMTNESKNLAILASEEPVEKPADMHTESVSLLFDVLRKDFGWVVVDLPRSSVTHCQELLSKATDIVILCDLSLPCARDVSRLLAFAKEINPVARIDVVANRAHGTKGQISKADFERGIEAKVTYVIPDDPKSVTTATNAGKALAVVAKRSPAVSVIRRLAVGIAGPGKKAAKKTFSLWGKRKA